MKSITAKVKIQFYQLSDEDPETYVMETIDKINEVLQREFPDISPVIFGNSIDSSDIEVDEILDVEYEEDED